MKRVLVTGAARGLGLAITQALSAHGHNVVAAIQPEQESAGLRALKHTDIVEADLSQVEDVDRLIASVREYDRLDGVVSNAGIAVPGALELVPLSQVRMQYQVNTFAPLQIIQGALPQLRAAKGRVVVIGAGQSRVPLPCGGPYASSKSAFSALMDSLRAEVSPFDIRISVIEPGAIKTGILNSSEHKWKAIRSGASQDIAANVMDRYDQSMEKSFAASARAFDTAMQPETLARFVLRVFEATKPKPRYLIGTEAKALGALTLLPSGIRAAMTAKMV